MPKRRLILFIVAAVALFLTGCETIDPIPTWTFFLLLYTTALGTWFLYGMNYRVFHRNKIKESLQSLIIPNFQNFMIFDFFLLVLPLLLWTISKFQFFLLAMLLFLSWMYAFAFDFGDEKFKLKEKFVIKNILIGLTWGCLTLLPCNHEAMIHWPLFFLVFAQVFMGSIIRDMDDVQHDQTFNIKTLPTQYGINTTIQILHLFNLLIGIVCYFLQTEMGFLWLTLITCIWRALNLVLVRIMPHQHHWTQTWNIGTCLIIYLVSLITF